jgi:hypothetical protein
MKFHNSTTWTLFICFGIVGAYVTTKRERCLGCFSVLYRRAAFDTRQWRSAWQSSRSPRVPPVPGTRVEQRKRLAAGIARLEDVSFDRSFTICFQGYSSGDDDMARLVTSLHFYCGYHDSHLPPTDVGRRPMDTRTNGGCTCAPSRRASKELSTSGRIDGNSQHNCLSRK